MKELIEFLNDNQGAIMVIITFVYVIATIIICSANIKSANASKAQLKESKRQFEESQKQAKAELEESKRQFLDQKKQFDKVERVRIMPYLIVEQIETYSRNSQIVFYIRLTNQGNGTLLELSMDYKKDSNDLIVYENNYSYVYNSPFKTRFLKIGDSSGVEIRIKDMPTNQKPLERVYITFNYKDMLNNLYKQELMFLYNGMEINLIETYSPKYAGGVNDV